MGYPTDPTDDPQYDAARTASKTPDKDLPIFADSSAAQFAQFQAWLATQETAPAPAEGEGAPIVEDAAPPVAGADAGSQAGYIAQLEAHVKALQDGKIQPRTDTVDPTADPRDAEIAELRTAMKQIQAQLAANAAAAVQPSGGATSGGEPVAHHLHLDDGSVLQGFAGQATHIAMSDGTVRRVIAAFPSELFAAIRDKF